LTTVNDNSAIMMRVNSRFQQFDRCQKKFGASPRPVFEQYRLSGETINMSEAFLYISTARSTEVLSTRSES